MQRRAAARWLVGFAAVEADPGEEVTVSVGVAARAFEHWDSRQAGWTAEPGTFQIAAGSSSVVLSLSGQITVT